MTRDTSDLIAFRIHGVSRGFLEEMAGFGLELTANQAIAFRVHGVTPSVIRETEDLGFRAPSANRLIAFRVHNIDRTFIDEMDAMGLTDLTAEQALRLRVHHVNADFRGEMKDLGLFGFTPDRLVAMRILNVDARFVAEMRGRDVQPQSLDRRIRDRGNGGSDNHYDPEVREALYSVLRDLAGGDVQLGVACTTGQDLRVRNRSGVVAHHVGVRRIGAGTA